MERQTGEVHSRGTRTLGATVWVVGIIATVGGIFDPTAAPDSPQWFPGLLILALEVVAVVRALRLGISVYADRVVSRGWLRTQTFPRSAVTGAGVIGYTGIWTRGTTTGMFLMLTLKVAGHTLSMPHVAGRAARTRRLAGRVEELLGIPPASQRVTRNPG